VNDGDRDQPLRAVLARSHELGHVGPDLEGHIDHALGFADAVGDAPRLALDLGSGGGLPGLVLARRWPTSSWVLLDGSPTRTTFLADAVEELALTDRVTVVTGRAEEVGHLEAHRAVFDLVVSRSFGPPAVVAECAAPFLIVGGRLVVSEPPGDADRWDHPDELAMLGLSAVPPTVPAGAARGRGSFRTLVQVSPCPPRYPRRVGIPAKRPLFTSER
jgi:16S rRNA (guanine527-N7)-methyltransferase